MRKLAVVFLFLCALRVEAQTASTITSIDPSSVKVNSGEHFLTVYGTNLGNRLVFDGPAGHFEVDVSATFSGSVVGWVPEAMLRKSGTYTLYVTGPNGNSNGVYFTVQGFKVFPLVILMPEAVFAQPKSREGAYVKYEVFPAGGDDPNPTVKCFPESGAFFPMGMSTVNCEASNIYGERATGKMTVSVLDRVAPVLTLPLEPIIVKPASREGARVEYKAYGTDAIYGEVLADCNPPSGSIFRIGITDVLCSATDADLNTAYGTFRVEVEGDGKPYDLTIHVPEFGIRTGAQSREGSVVYYDVKVEGTDDPRVELVCAPKSGAVFAIGRTDVACTAIDERGARGSNGFTVDVVDEKPPSIYRVYASPDVLTPADGRLVLVSLKVEVEDDIDLAPVCSVQGIASNEQIDLVDGDSEKNYQWKLISPLELELRATRTGRGARYYDITVSCSDYYGNSSEGMVRVTVPLTIGGDQSTTTPTTPTQPTSGRRRGVRKP